MKGLTDLQELKLSLLGNDVSDTDLAHLEGLPHLRRLRLDDTDSFVRSRREFAGGDTIAEISAQKNGHDMEHALEDLGHIHQKREFTVEVSNAADSTASGNNNGRASTSSKDDSEYHHKTDAASDETPLHWAASCDDVAVLDALLDAGADIHAPGAVIGGGSRTRGLARSERNACDSQESRERHQAIAHLFSPLELPFRRQTALVRVPGRQRRRDGRIHRKR